MCIPNVDPNESCAALRFPNVDPNESCALLNLFPELIVFVMETFEAPLIPMVMFTCKCAFRICNQFRMFQCYLVWKYQIPELIGISYRPQFNYLRKQSQRNKFMVECSKIDRFSPH